MIQNAAGVGEHIRRYGLIAWGAVHDVVTAFADLVSHFTVRIINEAVFVDTLYKLLQPGAGWKNSTLVQTMLQRCL